MYFDSKHNRVLLKNGESVLSPFQYARYILENKDYSEYKAIDSFDTDMYNILYKSDIASALDEVEIEPQEIDGDIDVLIDRIEQSPRLCYTDEEADRIEQELTYFQNSGNIHFLLKLCELIDKFKKNDVVWGVGRGSASASYVLYLLEVHDINALQYDIDFSEMSKEVEKYERRC